MHRFLTNLERQIKINKIDYSINIYTKYTTHYFLSETQMYSGLQKLLLSSTKGLVGALNFILSRDIVITQN